MQNVSELVDAFVQQALQHPQGSTDELVTSLRAIDIDDETAECLVAFVPMAFAHVILGDLGVALPSAFLLRDPDTGATARGALQDEPIFRAACVRARTMLESGADGQQSAREIASGSAEWNVIAQLTQNGSDPSACGLTEAVLMRLSPSYLSKP